MSRRTIARVIAVILLSYASAFMFVSVDKSDMAEYRSLSHTALLDKLAEDHKADFSSSFGIGLLVIGLAVGVVEALTFAVEKSMSLIVPVHPRGTPDSAVDLTGPPFH
ncbi:MAG TPA: hypothetical protein VGO46_12050 [Gemmatimonadaceae bacterium]|jgi:hypothetical protein|nr:hypothetical protein [Gemmatimonadaceae bacterium]